MDVVGWGGARARGPTGPHAVTVLERGAELRETGAGIGLMPNGVQALDALGLATGGRATPLPAGGACATARPGASSPSTRRRGPRRGAARRGGPHLAAPAPRPLPAGPRTGRRSSRCTTTAGAPPHRRRTARPARARGSPAGPQRTEHQSAAPPNHVPLTEVPPPRPASGTPGGRAPHRRPARGRRGRPGRGRRRCRQPAARPPLPRPPRAGGVRGVRGPGSRPRRTRRRAVPGELLDHRTASGRLMLMADGRTYWYATWAIPTFPPIRRAAGRIAGPPTGTPPSARCWPPPTRRRCTSPRRSGRRTATRPRRRADRPARRRRPRDDPRPRAGRCQAFEDAAALGALVDGGGPTDVVPALARYDALRRPRTTALQRQARQMNRMLRLRGPAGRLRDTILRAVPGVLAAPALARQFAFDPPRRG